VGYAVQIGDLRVTPGIRAAVARVLESERFTEGRETAAFESERAAQVGTRYAIAVNSGTSALMAALTALKYARDAGDVRRKVITTPLTYAADANAIALCGLEPVFIDVDPRTFGIRVDLIEQYLEQSGAEDVAAILPVHLMGYAVDAPRIRAVADGYGIDVVEDAAQADGARVGGRTAGAWGDLSISSLFVAHIIQAGEMGVVNTDDDELFALLRQIKANGRACKCAVCTRSAGRCPGWRNDIDSADPRFRHEVIGYNFKANEWTSAIAREQLAQIDDIALRRRKMFAAYSERLMAHESWLQLPPVVEGAVPFAYPIIVKPDSLTSRRSVCDALETAGVETRPMYPCIPMLQSFTRYRRAYSGNLPTAELVSKRGFFIGCHQFVTEANVELVGDTLDLIAERMST